MERGDGGHETNTKESMQIKRGEVTWTEQREEFMESTPLKTHSSTQELVCVCSCGVCSLSKYLNDRITRVWYLFNFI